MKPFEYYSTITVPYPSRDDFTTVFVYSKGKVMWEGSAIAYREHRAEFEGMVTERVFDQDAYKVAQSAFMVEDRRLSAEFKADLIAYHDMAGHPKVEKIYAKAWEDGHAHGYEEVASIFEDLVDLVK